MTKHLLTKPPAFALSFRAIAMMGCLLFCGLSSSLWAQAVDLLTYRDAEVSYAFTSSPNGPFVANANPADNGTVEIERIGTSIDYVLTYTPDQGFTGIDNFRLVRWVIDPVPHVEFVDITVTVSPALVVAYHDYGETVAGQLVAVDVLANDISSNGTKILQAIPAINYGEANFNSTTGLIEFTPSIDFSGEAHFNYVICNGAGDCDKGTMSITVLPATMPDISEEKIIFTKKNESQFVLVPPSYTLVDGPDNGTYDPAEDVPTYTPNADYVGLDEIRFTQNGHELICRIEVLDLETNTFAFDDRAFTTTGTEVEIDIKDNDQSVGNSCLSIDTQPENGTITQLSNGVVSYLPNPDFVGVDQFTYRSFLVACSGDPEIATVNVFVSNFEPAESTFEMATPRGMPIIIGYNVPVGTFTFEVAQQGELGEAMFLPGEVDTEINGVPIQGYNLLLYVPNEDVISGLDEFEITYCLADPSGSGDCYTTKRVKVWMDILDVDLGDVPSCVGDCVWPGDTNSDGVVNMADLLPIGWQMGQIGNQRPNATLEQWYGQYADDWGSLLTSGEELNIKHVDADGNSLVSAADTVAISDFYGRTHNMVPDVAPYAPYEFFLEAPLFVEPGDLVEIKIHLGTEEEPVQDVYGFVFPLNYNPDALRPDLMYINWTQDNFMAYDSPVLDMDHNDFGGSYEAGYTRTSGLRASGYGVVGTMNVVIDDVIGWRPDQEEIIIPVGGTDGLALNAQGEYVRVRVPEIKLRVRLKPEDLEAPNELRPELLKVGPNPTNGFLRVHLNGQQEIDQLSLRTLTGQLILDKKVGSNQDNLDLRHLIPGVYILSVSNEFGVVNTKVQVF